MKLFSIILISLAYFINVQVDAVLDETKLCNFLVDLNSREDCLNCFQAAGHLTTNPEGVRLCVGSHLPPLLAECSVPHARAKKPKTTAPPIVQVDPEHHDSHLNANFLPNCLRRRSRQLQRYLKIEGSYYKAATYNLTNVAKIQGVKGGGEGMLEVAALRQALKHLEKLPYVAIDINPDCIEDYLPKIDLSSKEGNNLPLDGVTPISREILQGKCIIEKLISKGHAPAIITHFTSSTSTSPIPKVWANDLLQSAKTATSYIIMD